MKVLALAILLCTVYQVSCARTMKLTEWDMRSDDSKVWRRVSVPCTVLGGLLQNKLCTCLVDRSILCHSQRMVERDFDLPTV